MDMSKLTQREKEVVNLLAQGKPQSQIADQLVISRYTVYNHIKNIKAKTGAASTFELAINTRRQMSS